MRGSRGMQRRRAFLRLACGSLGLLALARTARSVSAAQQVDTTTSDTPAARRLTEWLVAANSGNFETALAFHQHADRDNNVEYGRELAVHDLQIQRETGGLELRSVVAERSSDIVVVAVLQARLTQIWHEITLEVEPTYPWRIVSVGLMQISPPAGTTRLPKLSDTDVARELTTTVERLTDAGAFSGTVLLTKHGQTLVDLAFGLADRDTGRPNRTDTRFNLGSMNKMFTAVAVGQLVEQGRVAFTDTVGSLLPDRPLPGGDRITLHHLLTHTSGLGDIFGPRFSQGGKDQLNSVWDYFPLFQDAPLGFEPGARWRYSNAGFAVLGAVVERVSGTDYFEYIRRHVYAPAGMLDSDAFGRDDSVPNVAVGYTTIGPTGLEPGRPMPNTAWLPSRGGAAGGGYSTTGDLQRFADALLGYRLVGEAMTRELTSGKVMTGQLNGDQYAYGFADLRVRGVRIIGHGGGAPGINAALDMYPQLGVVFAVLTNVDFAANTVAQRARDILTYA